MKRVFIDTGGFIALLVAEDAAHDHALSRFREATDQRWELVTTNAVVRGHSDKTYSLCDALGFVVMERLGITEAVAYDRHFREYGRFTIL